MQEYNSISAWWHNLHTHAGKASNQGELSDDPLKELILTVLPESALTNSVLRYTYMPCTLLLQLYRSFSAHRPNWIKIYGEEYHRSSFVHYGWQKIDDLPQFAKILDILVVVGAPLLYVKLYETEGINNHLLAHSIISTHKTAVIHLVNRANNEIYHAHTYIHDRRLYIAMRAHVTQTM